MSKPPKRSKDPARPTRAKASRPELPPIAPALEKLLNPGIGQGTAGPGSGTGLKPPPDNSFDRRSDFSAEHRARKSTQQTSERGFGERPQGSYVPRGPASPALGPDSLTPADTNSELRKALGYGADPSKPVVRDPLPNPPPQAGEGWEGE